MGGMKRSGSLLFGGSSRQTLQNGDADEKMSVDGEGSVLVSHERWCSCEAKCTEFLKGLGIERQTVDNAWSIVYVAVGLNGSYRQTRPACLERRTGLCPTERLEAA
jgi:hypothetical protein